MGVLSFISDTIDDITSSGLYESVTDFAKSDMGKSLLQLGIGNLAKDQFQAQTPQVGYQGGIPDYQAVRSRVPMQAPNQYPLQQEEVPQTPRRPGEGGRRYFSDTIFATAPATPTPTLEEAQATAQAQANALAGIVPEPQTPVVPEPQTPVSEPQTPAGNATFDKINTGFAAGGIASAYNRRHNGYYLGGKTDGMADDVPATIDGTQEARLSDGEFVIPADVVSHLGNGNSDAGADQLHGMMDNVRMERTGNPEQGKQIDPNKFMPKMAQGGIAQAYNTGGGVANNIPGAPASTTPATTTPASTTPASTTPAGTTTTPASTTTTTSTTQETDGIYDNIGEEGGTLAGTESSLSNWAGPYVTDMLGRGQAISEMPYEAYTGPLSAGASGLQDQAFTGVGSLDQGIMGVQDFTAADATAGMNPYLMASLNPQLDEARRQSEIDRVANAGRMTKAGAFGGSRQALMDMEGQRGLQANLAGITGKGYKDAYDVARDQFNKTQTARNAYGFDVLNEQQEAGAAQRGIEAEGVAADYGQFREERDYPAKAVQYMQSLLQDMPLEAQSNYYTGPSSASQTAAGAAGVEDLLSLLGMGGGTSSNAGQPFNPATHGSATPAQIAAELAANPSMTNAQIKAKYP